MSIRTFAHKGVEEVFLTGRSRHIGAEFNRRMSLLLDAIDGATGVVDLRGVRGFHALHGDREGTFTMTVSGNRRLTFRFDTAPGETSSMSISRITTEDETQWR